MAAVAICSDFEAPQKMKSVTVSFLFVTVLFLPLFFSLNAVEQYNPYAVLCDISEHISLFDY